MVNDKKQKMHSPINPASQIDKINPQSVQIIQNAMINITLSSIMFGYSMVNFNAINFDDLLIIFDLNNKMDRSFCQGLFTCCIYIGACIGALTSSFLLKNITRKNCFYILNAICILGVLLIQTKIVALIVLGRLLQGFYIGAGSSIVPLYIKQFVPQLNGKYGLYHGLSFSIGVVLAFILNLLLHSIFNHTQNYWRYLFCLPIFISSLQTYNIYTKYPFETPRYLISEGRQKQGLQLLKLFYKPQFVDKQFQMLKQAIKSKKVQRVQSQSQHQIQLKVIQRMSNNKIKMQDGIMTQKQKRIRKQSLKTDSLFSHEGKTSLEVPLIKDTKFQIRSQKLNILPIFCALHLSFQQQIIGVGAVIVYSGQIVKQIIPQIFFVYPIVVNSFGIVGALIGIKLIHSKGRVFLIQVGGLIIFTCLITCGVNFINQENGNKLAILFCMIVMRTTLSCTLGPIVWLYMPQIVKPQIMSYAVVMNYAGATIIMFLFPIAKQYLQNPGWIFLFNGFMCLLSIIINYITLIQTKDKDQLTIKRSYLNRWNQLKDKFCYFNKK